MNLYKVPKMQEGLEAILRNREFFLLIIYIYIFLMVLCRITLDGQYDHPFFSHLNSILCNFLSTSHQSYGCLLAIVEFVLLINHCILVQSSRNLWLWKLLKTKMTFNKDNFPFSNHDIFVQFSKKLIIMKATQN